MSEQINELVTALAKAQAEMQNAPYNQTNPAFKSKYADLASIRDATIPSLTKHGLSLFQMTKLNGEGMSLVTRLAHSSGQWIESTYPLPIVDRPHIMGSAITYARRYSWAAICGIAAEADDDGNEAQEGSKNGTPPPKRTRAEISADANRKRQEVRDVEQDVLQIDSLAALDRYQREVLTPEFMAGLGMKQWSVEQKVGERRRELENAQADDIEDPPEFHRLRDEMIEHIQQTATEEDLLIWKESAAFRSDLDALPPEMQRAVRQAGATKIKTLQMAAR